MRRVVQDHVAASIHRAKPQLEQYIEQHLTYPEPFPFVFTEPAASIREIRHVKITPRFRADYPPLDIIVTMHISPTARTRKRDVELGTRSFGIDVELDALGLVQGYGYEIAAQDARLIASSAPREGAGVKAEGGREKACEILCDGAVERVDNPGAPTGLPVGLVASAAADG